MSKKSDLVERIKRRLGYPMIKVELHPDQIDDSINYARNKFIKFAVGQATQEVYFTLMLSGGQREYDMPAGTVEVIDYNSTSTNLGGINTLFTLGNFLFSQGAMDQLNPSGYTGGYSLLGYHMAIDFLETFARYNPDMYRYRYHKYNNVIEIFPTPKTGNLLSVQNDDGSYTDYDSPGFILIRAMMIEGSTLPDWSGIDDINFNLWDSQWIEDYATAKAKLVLGLIRRKFASFSALGNQGASLDGSELVSEAKEEMTTLEQQLRDTECYMGGAIIIG